VALPSSVIAGGVAEQIEHERRGVVLKEGLHHSMRARVGGPVEWGASVHVL